jgi:hypothetical protein
LNSNKIFPLDRIRYVDLEPVRVSETEVAFSQGYYYNRFSKKGQILDFNKIENTFQIGKEKITKKFTLSTTDIKHFYFKIELEDDSLITVQEDSIPEGDTEPSFKEELINIKSVTLVDEQISTEGNVLYPYCEPISIISNRNETNYVSYCVGPFIKEEKKSYYMYFCSLRIGHDKNTNANINQREISSWIFYNAKNSDDPALKGPYKTKIFLDVLDDEKEKELLEDTDFYDIYGAQYKLSEYNNDDTEKGIVSPESFLYRGIHYKTKRHESFDISVDGASLIPGSTNQTKCSSPLSLIGMKIKIKETDLPPT